RRPCPTRGSSAMARSSPLPAPRSTSALRPGPRPSHSIPRATEPLLSFRWAPRSPSKTNSGSSMGITYTPNGQYLLFSQDGDYGPAYVAIASVNSTTGLLSNYADVSVPLDVNGGGYLTHVTCYPWVAPFNTAKAPPSGSPPGTTGSIEIPCGQTV